VTSKTDKPSPDRGPAPRPERAKRRYEPPRLIDYGSVSKLTQSGGISVADNMGMFAKA
jgi:hypothetical protein